LYNIPVLCVGAYWCGLILAEYHKSVVDYGRIRRLTWFMCLYASGSILTVGHYTVELPPAFSAFVNFTISGEGIVAVMLVISVWIALRRFKYQQISMEETDTELIELNEDDVTETRESRFNRVENSVRRRTPLAEELGTDVGNK